MKFRGMSFAANFLMPRSCTKIFLTVSLLILELCLVVSPNIPSNSIARLPGTKLKMSLETYLPNLLCAIFYLEWLGQYKKDKFSLCLIN
jgi:hypothetical protein